MRWKKRYWSRLFLAVECVIFFAFYWFGAEGFRNLQIFDKEREKVEHEVATLSDEIDVINREIVAFENDPFYREKVAREQLQMARKNEEVYLIVKKKEE